MTQRPIDAGFYQRGCHCALRVIQTLWNRDGGENSDDRDDDHQFDQGKAALLFLHLDFSGFIYINITGAIDYIENKANLMPKKTGREGPFSV